MALKACPICPWLPPTTAHPICAFPTFLYLLDLYSSQKIQLWPQLFQEASDTPEDECMCASTCLSQPSL